MPAHELQLHLEELRNQLNQQPPLSAEERASILAVIAQIEAQIANQSPPPDGETLVDGISLAVERFEVSHPTLASTLRNVMQSLVSMGI